VNGFDLYFGLEDILFITGLPINGMPVTGIILQDAVQILVTHLAIEEMMQKICLKLNQNQN